VARSSVIGFLMLAATGGTAAAQVAPAGSAETAMDRYRHVFTPVAKAGCARTAAGEDILVCGRTGPDPNRLPLPVAPLPGARAPGGDPPDQRAAAEVGSEPCSTIGPNGGCGGYLPILPFAMWVANAAVKAVKEAREE
jgi:hypothetical protein